MLFDFTLQAQEMKRNSTWLKATSVKNMDLDLGFVFTNFSVFLISFFKYRFAGYIKVVRIEYNIRAHYFMERTGPNSHTILRNGPDD